MMVAPKDECDRLEAGVYDSNPLAGTVPMRVAIPVRASVKRMLEAEAVDEDGNVPPNDMHAEAALLGSLIWAGANARDQLSVDSLADVIADKSIFFGRAHQAIFGAILSLSAKKIAPDVIALRSELATQRVELQSVSLDYLDELMTGATTIAQPEVRAYAETIRAAWVRRKMVSAAKELENLARNPRSDVAESIAAQSTTLSDLAMLATRASGTVTSATAVKRVMKTIAAGNSTAYQTGFRCIDSEMSGLFPKEVSIIAARTSVGKSALATQIGYNIVAAHPGSAILYVSLEMAAEAFIMRLIANRTGIDSRLIRRSQVPNADLPRMMAEAKWIAEQPVRFVDSQSQTMASIAKHAHDVNAELMANGQKLVLVVIDHLHLIKPPNESMKRHEVLGQLSRGMNYIAEKQACHVIGLMQMNRRSEEEDMPKLHHLYESDAPAQNANNVFLIHRKRNKQGVFDDEQAAQLVVAKARDGGTYVAPLRYESRYVRFTDWEDGANGIEHGYR